MAESFVLYTGARIPSIGLGTGLIEPNDVVNAIYAAVKAGYRHIDCAPAYHNEKEVSLALKKLFEEGVVKREDLFITSKPWSGDHAPEDVAEAIGTTLKDLQLDFLDLFLIHGPIRIKKGTTRSPENFLPPDIPATWGAMEKLYVDYLAAAGSLLFDGYCQERTTSASRSAPTGLRDRWAKPTYRFNTPPQDG